MERAALASVGLACAVLSLLAQLSTNRTTSASAARKATASAGLIGRPSDGDQDEKERREEGQQRRAGLRKDDEEQDEGSDSQRLQPSRRQGGRERRKRKQAKAHRGRQPLRLA